MKRIMYLTFLFLLLISFSACSLKKESVNNNETDPSVTVNNKQNETSPPNKENSPDSKTEAPQETTKSIEKETSWKGNKISVKKYNLSDGICNISIMTAPSYVDDKTIIFIKDQENRDEIIEFNRQKQTCHSIYQTKGIGNMVGVKGQLFWSEYDTTKMSEVDWKIKSLNLADKNVITIATGGSYNDTPTPALRTSGNSVSWIQYKANTKNSTITSKLMNYDLHTKKALTINEENLDESKESNGEYFILQDTVENDGFLLYKSIFKNGDKHFNISSYEKGKNPITLTEQDQIIDFTSSKDYFVYTEEGSITAFKKSKPNQKITYNGGRVTFDTPIFIDSKTLIYRYGMNEIFISNLEQGICYSISDFKSSVSKPIYSNGLLAYGDFDSDGDKVSLNFYVVNIQ